MEENPEKKSEISEFDDLQIAPELSDEIKVLVKKMNQDGQNSCQTSEGLTVFRDKVAEEMEKGGAIILYSFCYESDIFHLSL